MREPDVLARVLTPQRDGAAPAQIVTVPGGAQARLSILPSRGLCPAGHTARHAMREVYAAIRAHRLSLVFVNTRMQAEFVFQNSGR